MFETSNHYVTVSFAIFVCSVFVLHQLTTNASINQKEFKNVVKDFGLEPYKPVIDYYDSKTVVEFVNFWSDKVQTKNIPDATAQKILKEKAEEIKQRFIFHRWLERNDLLELEKMFSSLGVNSIEKLLATDRLLFEVKLFEVKLSRKLLSAWNKASASLPNDASNFEEAGNLWLEIEEQAKEPWTTERFSMGDYAIINPITNGLQICCRSDETLKQRGCRFGSSEIYGVMDAFPEVGDSICVSKYSKKMDESAVLFLKMSDGHVFNSELVDRIRKAIAETLTPRHVPDIILETKDIPYNINSKKMEITVKKIINNMPYNADSIRNPQSLKLYCNLPEFDID